LLTGSLIATGCGGRKPAPPQGGKMGSGLENVPPDGSGLGNAIGERPLEGANLQRGLYEPVYFDFDSARVRPGEVTKLANVASKLRNSSSKLIVEGYADERGTAEYNRALAERRALACREELIRQGLPASSVSTASYGEEKPADSGHDEAAWSKNRRCEFVVAGQ
jgi:peptidoglycan-associated lipoprotein